MMLGKNRALAVLVAAGTALAACTPAGGPATTAPAGTPPAATTAPADTTAPAETAEATSPAGSPGAVEVPAPDKPNLKIGLSVTETSQFAEKMAQMAGIYEKYGFQIGPDDVTVFEGDGKTVQAMQAGQLDIAMVGVSSAITSQTTDAPFVILSTNASILSDNLVSTPDIKTADDLRGKCVAVSTYGGTSHGAVLLALQALGLTPQDVTIQEIGGQSNRIAALEGGACQAAPVDVALEEQMTAKGFNVLVNLKEEGLAWGRSGMGVRKDWLDENQNTALAVNAAVLEAQNLYWTDPDEAARHYAAFREIPQEEALALVQDFQTVGNRDLFSNEKAFQAPKDVLATVNPDIKDVDVTEAFDNTYLERLEEMGFYEQHGIPIEK